MRTVLLFSIACLLLMLGHILKTFRQKQLADTYEQVDAGVFLSALSAGYLLNFILPFRLGDILRAYLAGKRMKNGFSFSLATVIADRFLDIVAVGLIYGALFFGASAAAPENENASSALFYALLAGALVLLVFLCLTKKRPVKRIIKFLCGIFNERIELTLMVFFWALITAFRDMLKRISKSRLFIMTAGMWTAYLGSYYVFARTISTESATFSMTDIFSMLFSSGSMDMGALFQVLKMGGLKTSVTGMLSLYLLITSLLGLLIGRLMMKPGLQEQDRTLNLLPQINPQDKLQFLESYFEADAVEYIRAYLSVTGDISIIKDYSSGSNATTMLCLKEGTTVFRKYVVGPEADKLNEQIQWIQSMQEGGGVPLTQIREIRYRAGEICCYDMAYFPEASGFFSFIHSNPMERSWEIICRILEDLDREIYSKSLGKLGMERAGEYVAEKVERNLKRINEGHVLQEILKYDELIINGRRLKNLKHFEGMLSMENLKAVFAEDDTARIHGDLTVENIITLPKGEGHPGGYYLIDPNPSDRFDSIAIDYAKLLQSLRGGYEFYMNTQGVTVKGNEIRFLSSRSVLYDGLNEKYGTYLKERFTPKELCSIRYHEIVNWLRLMPYKLEKTGKRAVLFYAGLIGALNELEQDLSGR